MTTGEPLLTIRNLHVSFQTPSGTLRAVDGVDLELVMGEILAVVGESGSGKSVTAQTVIGLTRSPGARHEGSIRYGNRELLHATESELREVRGAEIAMVFQDPMTSLNPLTRVGEQIVEMLRLHTELSRDAAREEAVRLLGEVGIGQAEQRAQRYPHEFSGGMRQRAMIALALACNPKVLLADEPTTALDVTIQAQILRLISSLRERHGTAVVLITHDLGVVAELADRVAVMYAGKVVEVASCRDLFRDPQHPYTWGLLGSVTRVDRPRSRRLRSIAGMPPSLIDPPRGCPYRERCPLAGDECEEMPALADRLGVGGRLDACLREPAVKRARRHEAIGEAV